MQTEERLDGKEAEDEHIRRRHSSTAVVDDNDEEEGVGAVAVAVAVAVAITIASTCCASAAVETARVQSRNAVFIVASEYGFYHK